MRVLRLLRGAEPWCVATLLAVFAGPAFAAEQVITPDAATVSVGPGQTVTVAVSYFTANPGDETLTGLGLRVHFDSTKLSFGSLAIVEDRDLLSQDGAPQADAGNFDDDASTDRFYNVAWTDLGGNWPGVSRTPDLLYRVTFTTASNFTGTTTIRFSASGTAAGYALRATPVQVTSAGTPDTTPPIITLLGGATLNVTAGGTFTDPGATATDNVDGDISSRIVVTGNVNTAVTGSYTLSYNVSDAAGNAATTRTRTVNVTAAADTTAPVLTLPPDTRVEIERSAGTPRTSARLAAFFAAASANDARDGAVAVTNDAPEVFPFGTTSVRFSATDAAGNTASGSATLTVVDTTPPVLDVPADISVELETTAGTARSSAQLAAFFATARATDVRDGGLTVTHNAPATFPFGATMVTFSATDTAGNRVTSTVTVTVIDTLPPVLTAPADVTVDATGRLTQVDVHASAASATDARDGSVTITVSGRPASDNYLAGRTVLTYTARDAAGNTASDEQMVNVNPIIQLGANQQVSEGQRVVVPVLLSGDAPVYPVRAMYSVSGTATAPDDHDARAAELTILTGRAGTIAFDVVRDSVAEAAESVVLRLTGATNAVVGARASQTVEIVEANVAPLVDITLRQGGGPAARVLRSGGTVTATALVSDANSADTFAYDWGTSSTALASTNGTNSSTFVFDPSAVAAGAYPLVVKVTDSANATTTRALTVIVAAAPTLGTADTDGDGASDATEGTADTDGDGIANYLDADGNREFLPLQAGAGVTGRQMQTESGLRLALGAAALAANGSSATLSASDIGSFGDSGRSTSASDSMFTYSLPFFDFVVDGAAPGDSVAVVIPLPTGLPGGTLSYRKLKGTSYAAFTENGANSVSSAAAVNGVCPPPRSGSYSAGLVAGRACVQLVIQDGGPNDLDGVTDGRVVDPGSVAAAVAAAPPPAASGGGGGGGCSAGDGAGDPTLPVLAVLALLHVLRRRRVRSSTRVWRGA